MQPFDHATKLALAFCFVSIAELTGCDDAPPGKSGSDIPPPTGDAAYGEVSKTCRDAALTATNVHYVCDCGDGADSNCVPGDDGAAGTSGEPLRTFHAAVARFNAISGGDAVVLCRGGAFPVTTSESIYNMKCSASTRCLLRDYTPSWGSGDEGSPLLYASGIGTQYMIQFADPAAANQDGGYAIHNLSIDGNGIETAVFLYNDVDDVDFCNLSIRDAKIGVNLNGSNPVDSNDAKANGKNERVTFRGSYIHDTTEQGWLGSGDDMRLTSNLFDYNGTDALPTLHSIYVDSVGDRITISGNLVWHSTHAPGGRCRGVALVVHGQHADVVIEDNEIRFDVGEVDDLCYGIAVDAGYAGEAEAFSAVVIRRNRVFHPGNVAIGTSSCTDCLIEDNLVVQGQPGFDGSAIVVNDRPHASEDLGSARGAVRSNTLVFASAREWNGVEVRNEGAGYLVANNVVASTAGGRLTCFAYDGLPSGAYAADHNVCHSTSGMLVWSDAGNLASVQTGGKDTHSSVAAPAFTPSSDETYLPSASSPLRDAADPATSSPWDITGGPRGDKPDIGAFEAR